MMSGNCCSYLVVSWKIDDKDSIKTSFPNFLDIKKNLEEE